MHVIHKLKLNNFMGIEARTYEFPPNGAIVEGGNAKGKTTVLKAIRAALAGQGIGPDAIRTGASSAEVLVDLDEVSVRRAITRSGTSVQVLNRDGWEVKAPQRYLTSLLGVSPLDPLDLFLEKDPKKRRAKILAALPITVTAEQLTAWLPSGTPAGDVSGHGLDVLERHRAAFYDARSQANREEDARAHTVDALRTKMETESASLALEELHPGDAEKLRRAAVDAHAELQARAREAASAQDGAERRRARIFELRTQAKAKRDSAPTVPEQQPKALDTEFAHLDTQAQALSKQIADLQTDLIEVQRRRNAVVDERIGLQKMIDVAAFAEREAKGLDQLADQLAAEITAGAPAAPTADELASARQRVTDSETALGAAQRAHEDRVRLDKTQDEHAAAKKAHIAAKARADGLDVIVKRLTHEAPAALLAAANAIPGLTVNGEDVMLDGVSLDRLSGAEQMRFAVEIAKRLNAKSKLLVVDGLERLDADQLRTFVEHATSGGYQLLATRVTSGPAEVRPLEAQPGA